MHGLPLGQTEGSPSSGHSSGTSSPVSCSYSHCQRRCCNHVPCRIPLLLLPLQRCDASGPASARASTAARAAAPASAVAAPAAPRSAGLHAIAAAASAARSSSRALTSAAAATLPTAARLTIGGVGQGGARGGEGGGARGASQRSSVPLSALGQVPAALARASAVPRRTTAGPGAGMEAARLMEAASEGGCGDGGGGGGGGGGDSGALWPPAEERLAAVVGRLRALPRRDYPPVSGRAAAVLLGLFEDATGVVRVLLTQRSAALKSHRGEVCLPGGKRDEGDADDVATALREAQEELGLDPARVVPLATLPPVLSKHHLSVTPVLALLPPDTVPAPNPQECAAAFTVPLAVFLGQLTDPRVASGGGSGSGNGGGGGGGGGGARRAVGRRTRQRTAVPVAAAAVAEPPSPRRQAALSWLATEDVEAAAAEGGGGGSGLTIAADVAFEAVIHTHRDIGWGGHQYRIHSFQYEDYDVWGLTATICIDAAQLAFGRPPSFQVQCPGGHHYSAFFWDGSALRVRTAAAAAGTRPSGAPAGWRSGDEEAEAAVAAEAAAVAACEAVEAAVTAAVAAGRARVQAQASS